ncbi:DUF6705 family protein [Flavobacterium subsaxonicum]|uniref:DUF6705 domain-containing protein n=1 Tax=Flavobacterium subsaxonicum WB 4.1-42 = DSM 21790 TaxID=1121898 RepID=A0A0A2MSE9_9FLAO|nr:DUF6705 family protein [Flavobacterium subsaxonicum]KGO94393.1 hypothetical protein Q766_05615 [Flavobacterium subsaxonicum WB 4.1-42 = DSM 21790]
MKIQLQIYILLWCAFGFSQQPPILSVTSLANTEHDATLTINGNYAIDTNNDRNQYVGTWEYNQNGIIFQLKIEKADQVITIIESNGTTAEHYSYCDEVILRYKLIKNGITLNNNLNQAVTSITTSTSYGFKQASSDFLRGRIFDYTRNVVGSYTIKKLIGAPQKILFNLSRFNYKQHNPDTFYQDGQPLFTIPVGEIEMVKIN